MLKDLLVKKSFIIPTILLSLLYVVLTLWLMNGRLVFVTFSSTFSISAKIEILWSLILGMFTSMTPISLVLLITSGVLTGANITLIMQKITLLRKTGKLQLTLGGGLFLGIAGSGCAACGLPVISLLGLSGGVAFLPFHGTELPILAIFLLSLSLFFLIKSLQQVVCVLPGRAE